MPLLSGIIAKVLAFTEQILDFFVLAVPNGSYVGNCATVVTYNTYVLPCGWSVAHALAGLSEVGLVVLNYLFMGLMST